jgi:hypothetical protein
LAGRARALAAALALSAALALVAAGCGAEEHKSSGRPQPATRVSVAITDHEVSVQPPRIAIGPEPTQLIPQNRGNSQPQIRSNAPLSVVVVAANLTASDTELILRGPSDATLDELFANANGRLPTELKTGVYTLSAKGLPDATPGRLVVGPYRTSSQNDVLQP